MPCGRFLGGALLVAVSLLWRQAMPVAYSADTPASPPASGSSAPAARPCASEAHRQFDFWQGEWLVRDAKGRQVGRNRIERVADGCALQEHWTGNGNVSGTSLNFYDVQDRLWHQVWIDNSGGTLFLSGKATDHGMTLQGSTPSPSRSGQRDQQRIAWTQRADGTVRQLWESSTDDGQTWTVVFDGLYIKSRG